MNEEQITFNEKTWHVVNLVVEFDVEEVRKACDEETKVLITEHIYETCDCDECTLRIGRLPTSVRCIGNDEGMQEKPNVQYQLVARGLK